MRGVHHWWARAVPFRHCWIYLLSDVNEGILDKESTFEKMDAINPTFELIDLKY